MTAASCPRPEPQYRSIAETLDGQVIVGNEHGYFIKGRVVIGAFHPDTMENYIHEDDLVILGNRAEDQLCAIEMMKRAASWWGWEPRCPGPFRSWRRI